ncbi:hypothetical protein ACIPSE_30705 [Streptomyces sp. NPDC090106]|uniref:Rv1733c family protein n=1 Tax=Streptomyces sp. NPDC090106 TaxID=3365946 RepID=UPI0038184663
MRQRVRGWRRRENPLRRRSDVVEAWTALAVVALLLVLAPLVGTLTACWAHTEAQRAAAAQRADRHSVRAEVVGPIPETLPTVQGNGPRTVRTTVAWTEPGQARRTADARVPAGSHPGDMVEVWFDDRGRNVQEPPSGVAVWQHTLTIGVCAGAGTVGVILLGRLLVRQVSLRHRLAEWEEEWARTEPEWTRRRSA